MVAAVVLLSELLSASQVKVPLEAGTKDEALAELVAVLAAARCIRDADEVLRVIREREAVLSTGIGNGVAIPHGKSIASPELSIAAGVARQPLEYDALDGEPVQLIFLLVGPEAAAGAHIKALSRISRLVRQPELREKLLESADSDAFIEAVREAEIG
jgi:mannitol/fructose-specific phosphotransferase system IIA component (Ntr-type)